MKPAEQPSEPHERMNKKGKVVLEFREAMLCLYMRGIKVTIKFHHELAVFRF